MKKIIFSNTPKILFQHPVGWSILALVFLVSFSFFPALNNDFVYWDDQYYVTENPLLTSPTWAHFKMLTNTIISLNYHPLTMMSLWVNAFFSGTQDAFPYIATNLFFHLLNTLLVFFFIRKIYSKSNLVAFVTALIFAIHPMHVESVVWVSERKDVLYTFFFLLASMQYLKYIETQKVKNLWVTFLFFSLSASAKATAVAFVPVLFLLDFYTQKKWKTSKIYFEKIPFILLALLVGWIAVNVQAGGNFYGLLERTSDATALSQSLNKSFWEKLSVASYGLLFYLEKFICPFDLAALHPYSSVLDKTYFSYLPWFGFSFLIVLLYSFFKNTKVAFGLGFFLLPLLLVLQFIPVGVAIVAERYTYLPYLGLGFLTALFLKNLQPFISKWGTISILILLTGFLAHRTRIQVKLWKNHTSLFSNVVKIYPKNAYAREYLATGLWMEGELDSAIFHLEYAINELNYNNTFAFEQLAICWDDKNEPEKALAFFDKAVELDSTNFTARYHRSLTLISFDPAAALEDLNACQNSNHQKLRQLIYEPRARCHGALGNYENALADFSKALEFTATEEERKMIFYNRGITFELMHNAGKAIENYKQAMKIDPSFEDAQARISLLENR